MSVATKAAGLGAAAVVTGIVVLALVWVPPNERPTDGPADQQQLSGSLVAAGASSQQAAMQGWTAGFRSVAPGVTVDYDPIGSGGGRAQFLEGGVDLAGSDAPLEGDELTRADARCGGGGIVELPNYISPIAVVYRLEGVAELNLSPSTLAGIFDQRVTRWDDSAIRADNPTTELPDRSITPVNRSDESGTTENFTAYLAAAGGDAWPHEPSGAWPVSGGESAQGNAGVVAAVSGGDGTIGYADLSQARELGVARIEVAGAFVAPSADAAAAVVEDSAVLPGRSEHDLALELARGSAGPGQYPIVLVSYHVACLEYDDPGTAARVRAFLGYVISPAGQAAAAEVAGSAPLSDRLRARAQEAVDAIGAGR